MQKEKNNKKILTTSEIKSMFASFIAEHYMETKKITKLTSYRYKHVFEKMMKNSNIYLSNEDAKEVFKTLGYRTLKETLNEQYNIKLRPQFRYNEQNRDFIVDKIKKKQQILEKYSKVGGF